MQLCRFAVLLLAIPAAAGAQIDKGHWSLVWSDEFNGRNPAVDATKWVIETGGGGFGNDELEYYTARPQNVQVRHGNLIVKALKENYTGPDGVTRGYTSARIKSQTKFSQAYGRFEARIKIPRGQGLKSAIGLADRKSTRLNSSHVAISYAVFCLKKNKYIGHIERIRHS